MAGSKEEKFDHPTQKPMVCMETPIANHDFAEVYQPFAGSGTTGIVARELGAHFIGLDLSYSYLHEQARERLGLGALDAWSIGEARQDGKIITDLPLFKGGA